MGNYCFYAGIIIGISCFVGFLVYWFKFMTTEQREETEFINIIEWGIAMPVVMGLIAPTLLIAAVPIGLLYLLTKLLKSL